MKYPKGSAGAAEQKENRIIVAAISVLTIIVGLLLFAIPNDLHSAVKTASGAWKICGVVCLLAAVGCIVKGVTAVDDTKKYAMAWLVLTALGIFCSCGWFEGVY